MPGFFGLDSDKSDLYCGQNKAFNKSTLPNPQNQDRISPNAFDETFRKYRYSVQIYDLISKGSAPTIYLEACTRPRVEFDKITIHNGQDEIYRPGKSRWQPITLTFYEAFWSRQGTTYQVAEAIYLWHSRLLTRFNDTNAGARYSSIRRAETYEKNAVLTMEDGYGKPIRDYYLFGCWPSSVSPDELNYSASDLTRIEVELTYNRAEEKGYPA